MHINLKFFILYLYMFYLAVKQLFGRSLLLVLYTPGSSNESTRQNIFYTFQG